MTEAASSHILRLVKFIVPVGSLGNHSSIKKGNFSNLLLWMIFRDVVGLRSDHWERCLKLFVRKFYFLRGDGLQGWSLPCRFKQILSFISPSIFLALLDRPFCSSFILDFSKISSPFWSLSIASRNTPDLDRNMNILYPNILWD